MNELGLVLLGGALTLAATVFNERFKQVNATRAAATLVVRELEFHKVRLALAAAPDQHEGATYNLLFPSPHWSAHSAALLAGAPPQEAEAILNWYASLDFVGYTLGRDLDPDGRLRIRGQERTPLSGTHECP
jgi:hypothetical protein